MSPPVVLLHGCGGSAHAAFAATGWREAFGDRALAPDLPGHGAGQSHDPADYGDMAGALLERLPERFDAVGFSLGSKLLLDIAVRAPGRIRRLVLGGIGDNVFAPEAIGEAAARALEEGPDETTPPPVLAFLATWEPERNDARAVAAVLRRPPNPVFVEDELRALDLPILIVNGGEDIVGKLGRRLVEALPNVKELILPGIGHFDLTAQADFRRAAQDFLA
jgi:pimeloyl-ACP methyl ester carboxylesterase